jgi:hypothetical protein
MCVSSAVSLKSPWPIIHNPAALLIMRDATRDEIAPIGVGSG